MALDDLIKALDDDSAGTTTSSVRQTNGLRRAVAEAVGMGLAESANDLTNEALRSSWPATHEYACSSSSS